MEKGIHLKMRSGVIYLLTSDNEEITKAHLINYYNHDVLITILETGEELKLEDIFET
jgi:hypothetical protein